MFTGNRSFVVPPITGLLLCSISCGCACLGSICCTGGILTDFLPLEAMAREGMSSVHLVYTASASVPGTCSPILKWLPSLPSSSRGWW